MTIKELEKQVDEVWNSYINYLKQKKPLSKDAYATLRQYYIDIYGCEKVIVFNNEGKWIRWVPDIEMLPKGYHKK